jgi:hypothetical protein
MRRRPVLALGAAGALAAVVALAMGVGAGAGAVDPGPAVWIGTHVWTMNNDRFGGMSAIEVSPDGAGFLALSDRGAVVPGTFRRDGDGRITGVETGPLGVLRARRDGALTPARSDSEGLALAPDGTFFVSFEIAPRVLHYVEPYGRPDILPIPREFSSMPSNGALEALAIGPDGALYTLPEKSTRRDGGFGLFRFRDGTWDMPVVLPASGPFLPVGADFGPDGRLYLLERDFGVLGFATRVRRFVVEGDAIDAGEVVLETGAGTYGNLEGISVWRDGAGRLRLTMVADNNFQSFLNTEIVEFAVRD